MLILSRKNPKELDSILQLVGGELHAVPTLVVVDWHDPDETLELLRLVAGEVLTPPLTSSGVLSGVGRLLKRGCDGDYLAPCSKKRSE
jgi:hypothetical protein